MTEAMNFHDWQLCSIKLGAGSATFGFRDPEGDEQQRLIAEDVAHLVCDDLREGNTVLSVDVGMEYVTDQQLMRIIGVNTYVDRSDQVTRLRSRLESGELQFVRILPSYGADVVILAKSFSTMS